MENNCVMRSDCFGTNRNYEALQTVFSQTGSPMSKRSLYSLHDVLIFHRYGRRSVDTPSWGHCIKRHPQGNVLLACRNRHLLPGHQNFRCSMRLRWSKERTEIKLQSRNACIGEMSVSMCPLAMYDFRSHMRFCLLMINRWTVWFQ